MDSPHPQLENDLSFRPCWSLSLSSPSMSDPMWMMLEGGREGGRPEAKTPDRRDVQAWFSGGGRIKRDAAERGSEATDRLATFQSHLCIEA